MFLKRTIYLLFTLSLPCVAIAQDYPATEVYLLHIEKNGKSFSIPDKSLPENISNNKGYDNQPSFIEPLHAIAYVSSRSNKPTDVYLYDLTTQQSTQFTNNTEAEFSPKVTPDKKHISVVKGGEQNLTRIALDGAATEKLYTCKDSIGYYCWLDKDNIGALVLSKPETLRLINIKDRTERYLADSIGRSLFNYDDGILICRMLHSGNQVTFIDRKGSCTNKISLPPGTEDFYVTEDGWLFSSDGSKLVYCHIDDAANGWRELTDLKAMGISKILRLAVNRKKNMLAFVTADK